MKKLFKILFILSAFIINTQTVSCKNNLTIPVQNTSQNNYIEQNSDFKAGVNFILNSKYQEAINCFDTYLNNNTSVNPDVYFQKGYAYMAMGDKENAYNHFQLALRYNPNNIYTLVNYINIKLNNRKYFTFIKTTICNITGNKIPHKDLNEIREIFNSGITFWNMENNPKFGSYLVDNKEV